MSMFPYEHVLLIKDLTERRLLAKGKRGTSVTELLRFFGILILATRSEFRNMADLWMTESTSKYVPAPCFGKTGISRDRFQEILSCIRFSRQPDEQGELSSVQWRWKLADDFIHAINKHRDANVVPAELICVDESISRWYGRGGHRIDVGLPHYVAIDRKPENGCEIQDACCGRSGIILRLELVTTAEEEASRESESDMLHGAAVLKRLVKHWAGSGRMVCTDSYFASVSAAERLSNMGLKFIGVVKTATKKYPMPYLGIQELSKRGQHISLVRKSVSGSVEMMALMWLDRERRYFISTTSTTEQGRPYVRERWRQLDSGPQRVELVIPQPKVCEIYYSACAQIDRHNRSRQDDLNLEKKVGTKDWSFRVNCSLLAMIVVDSWLLYSGAEGCRKHMSQRKFYETLATELIDNCFDRPFSRTIGISPKSEKSRDSTGCTAPSGIGIHLTPTRQKRRTNEGTATSPMHFRASVEFAKLRRPLIYVLLVMTLITLLYGFAEVRKVGVAS